MKQLNLRIADASGVETPVTIAIDEVLLAGYTGRDRSAAMEHIRELEAIGVAPPPSVPMVYVVDPGLLTTDAMITVSEPETSGEVEACLVFHNGELLAGLGSDHTDRKAEAVDIAESKTLCNKPISTTFWRFADVRDHWDEIEIHSWVTESGSRRLYQEGTLREFLAVEDLLGELKRAGHADLAGRFIFGGTIPTVGGLACGERFEAELRDPLLRRTLTCNYEIQVQRGSANA